MSTSDPCLVSSVFGKIDVTCFVLFAVWSLLTSSLPFHCKSLFSCSVVLPSVSRGPKAGSWESLVSPRLVSHAVGSTRRLLSACCCYELLSDLLECCDKCCQTNLFDSFGVPVGALCAPDLFRSSSLKAFVESREGVVVSQLCVFVLLAGPISLLVPN